MPAEPAASRPSARDMGRPLVGKVALVTAASRGLGRAAALALSTAGARVAICARGREDLEAAAADIEAATGSSVVPIVADLAVPADVRRLVQHTVARASALDILVTNTGGPPSGRFESLDDGDWGQAIDSVFMSVVRLCREAIPHMRQRPGGRIIAITSVAVKQPVDGLILSNATRAAIVGFMKTLAGELAGEGILVNCVAPGYTRTDRVVELARAAAAREGVEPSVVLDRTVAGIPLRRLGEPGELAGLIAFLASEGGSYITGATIPVDGGYVRGLL